MNKFLLFTTGAGSADPLNWSSDEAALYSTSELKGMKPASSRTIDLFFETTYGKEVVTLGIKNSTHASVMKSISAALNSNQSVISIADADNEKYCSPFIISVRIVSQETHCQSLTTNTKTKINSVRSNYNSCMIANTSTSNVQLDLYLANKAVKQSNSSFGSGISYTNTTVLANGAEAVSTSSVALAVDTVNAVDDTFLDERVYNKYGDFIGTCTAVPNTTTLTFGGGIEIAVVNNDALYTGTRYRLMKDISIPGNTTLVLDSSEISFDSSTYNLYAKSGASGGDLTFTLNY